MYLRWIRSKRLHLSGLSLPRLLLLSSSLGPLTMSSDDLEKRSIASPSPIPKHPPAEESATCHSWLQQASSTLKTYGVETHGSVGSVLFLRTQLMSAIPLSAYHQSPQRTKHTRASSTSFSYGSVPTPASSRTSHIAKLILL
jgi:hypothetical protein